MISNASRKSRHIVIIGAGPQGLATGIELLQAGHNVTILESKEQLGQGVSYRPDHSQWGIAHSGAYYPSDTERARLSFKLYDALKHPQTDDAVLQTYLKNSKKIGKLIVARNEEGLKNLDIFAKRLAAGHANYSRLTDPHDIADLKEPTLGDLNAIKAVLHLPEVRVINIKNYIDDLRKTFQEKGGSLLRSHEVTEFVVPTEYKRGTTIKCKGPSRDLTLHADAVINMAGLYAAPVAEMAAKALTESHTEGWGAKTQPPQTPKALYCKYGVLVKKDSAPVRPEEQTRHVVYVADSAVLDGPKSTVGAHSYVSRKDTDGLWPLTIGPFIHHGMDKETIEATELPDSCTMNENMWKAAHGVLPNMHSEDFDYKLIGRIANYVRTDGARDFFKTSCADANTGFRVLNCFTSDSPGLTCSPVIAKETAQEITTLINQTKNSLVSQR